jgi:Mechanosensitive ion channel MscS, C-terminal
MKTLILSVSLGLLLGLAVRPAWGQSNRQETVKAPGHESSAKPPAVGPDIPVDDFDRGTPRRAVAGFLKAARADDYRRAAEYLDLRDFGLPADEAKTLGAQLARHLKIVLDQKLPIDSDTLSNSPAGHLQDALPPDVEEARIRFAGFGSSSFDLEVFSYVTVTDYGEYLEIAEDLNLRIMDIIAAAGSSLALPSQTTYVEKGRGLDSDRARAAEAQVKEWREQHELWLPHFPREKIIEIDNTLEYPGRGSNMGAGRR